LRLREECSHFSDRAFRIVSSPHGGEQSVARALPKGHVAMNRTSTPSARAMKIAGPADFEIRIIAGHSGAPRSGEPGIHNHRPRVMDSGLAT